MAKETQQDVAKRSSRVARRFFWRFAGHAPVLLREAANLRDDGISRFQQQYSLARVALPYPQPAGKSASGQLWLRIKSPLPDEPPKA
jgi:hypothetical protein